MYRVTFETLRDCELARWFYGMGTGTFLIFGPIIQKRTHYMERAGAWWPWLHSDWLQAILEQGLVGFALYLWLATDCARRAARAGDTRLLAAFLGVCATGVFQYPLRLSLFALLAAFVVVLCLRGRPLAVGSAT